MGSRSTRRKKRIPIKYKGFFFKKLEQEKTPVSTSILDWEDPTLTFVMAMYCLMVVLSSLSNVNLLSVRHLLVR
jgi:hypothetical protein